MGKPLPIAAVWLVAGVAAFFLGPILWPMHPSIPTPTAGQLPFLILLSALEAAAFGAGIAFVAFGYPALKKVTLLTPGLRMAVFVSIAWLLVSWWPHDNFHMYVALQLSGLIGIEYGFHVTLLVCGLILAYAGMRLYREQLARV